MIQNEALFQVFESILRLDAFVLLKTTFVDQKTKNDTKMLFFAQISFWLRTPNFGHMTPKMSPKHSPSVLKAISYLSHYQKCHTGQYKKFRNFRFLANPRFLAFLADFRSFFANLELGPRDSLFKIWEFFFYGMTDRPYLEGYFVLKCTGIWKSFFGRNFHDNSFTKNFKIFLRIENIFQNFKICHIAKNSKHY